MSDTYKGNLNVEPTAELNPYLFSLQLEDPLHGYPYAKYYLDINQTPQASPTLDLDRMPVYMLGSIRNDGDENIEVGLVIKFDGGAPENTETCVLGPGNDESIKVTLTSSVLTEGAHHTGYGIRARIPGGAWKPYYTGSNAYLVPPPACTCTSWVNAECPAVGKRRQTRTCTPTGCDIEERIIDDPGCKPFGDITKVTLDGKLLPEGGTLDWILNDDAAVKVFFKNTGNVASAFHIWLTDDTGLPPITGCDVTTGSIPADDAEYYVDLCVFLPDVVKLKTLTAHITP